MMKMKTRRMRMIWKRVEEVRRKDKPSSSTVASYTGSTAPLLFCCCFLLVVTRLAVSPPSHRTIFINFPHPCIHSDVLNPVATPYFHFPLNRHLLRIYKRTHSQHTNTHIQPDQIRIKPKPTPMYPPDFIVLRPEVRFHLCITYGLHGRMDYVYMK
jgi:hypothetical protein